jgi:signal transduction histidine kinase
VEVELSLDTGVPLTWADPFQIQQVLLNLLGNAEQALEGWEGERRITLRTSWAGTDADPIVVAVGDTGPGIPAEQVERIFNPFYTTKPVGQGTGLGLSISDGIVREHGGRIRVESKPGRGATFHVELPRVSPPEIAPAPAGDVASRQRVG